MQAIFFVQKSELVNLKLSLKCDHFCQISTVTFFVTFSYRYVPLDFMQFSYRFYTVQYSCNCYTTDITMSCPIYFAQYPHHYIYYVSKLRVRIETWKWFSKIVSFWLC